jgi:hypothetical protein
MSPAELREDIAFELEQLEAAVQEIIMLRDEIGERDADLREKTLVASFLAQFYSGIENILKRICKFQQVPLPVGESWHIDLFTRFCSPPFPTLPRLFDEELAAALVSFRKFRHVVFHGYSFRLDWSRLRQGAEATDTVFRNFKTTLNKYIASLP